MVPNPFSPTGFVPVPPDTTTNLAGLVPKDIPGAAQAILAKVVVDKPSVHLRSYETSQDAVHVRNDMPGQVTLKLDKPEIPGLKVTVGKTDLTSARRDHHHFRVAPGRPCHQCLECAKKMNGHRSVQLHVVPTGQVLPIAIDFQNTPRSAQPVPPPAPGTQVPAAQVPAPPK